MTKQPFFIFLVSVWILLIPTGCSESPDHGTGGGPDEPLKVTVSEIKPWREAVTRHVSGVVRPNRRAVLSTRMNGTVQSIRVNAGDRVAAGAELAHVESRDVEAALAAAEEQLTAAEAARDQAVRDADRLQRLADEDLIARQRLEHARVKQRDAGAGVEKARAEVTAQQINRSYAHIQAPFSGIVSEVLIDEGSFTGPGQPVLILEDRAVLRIDIPVSSEMAGRFASSEKLSVVNPQLPEPVSAEYVATVPALEAAAAGQIVRLCVNDPPPALQPGQVVDVLLNTAAKKKWTALPRSALIRRGQLTGALVLDQQEDEARVRLRWIRIAGGVSGDSKTLPVSQGLKRGEFVVLHPSPDLQDGQPVQPERVSP